MFDWDSLNAMSLQEFMEKDSISEFVKYKNLYALMFCKEESLAHGSMIIMPCLTVYQITSALRPENIKYTKNPTSTGQFREFSDLLCEQAKAHGQSVVMFKCVVNDFVADKLIEYGYFENTNAPCHPDFYKYVR